MRRTRLLVAGSTAALLLVPLLGVTTSTADSARYGGGHGHGHGHGHGYEIDDLRTVASGLDNPRGLVAGRDGVLYVALSGRGHDAATAGMTAEEAAALGLPCFPGPEGLTCLGDTGAIGRLDTHRRHRHGHPVTRFRTVVDGLPSLASPGGGNAIGVTDVSLDRRGRLFATVGLGGDPALRETVLADADGAEQLATLNRVDLRRGTLREVADLGDFEAEENPAGGTVDTNPYALVSGRRGHVVADAGANALLKVRRDGSVEAEYVFPDELVTVPPPAGGDGAAQAPAQAVPNAVVRGPDGAYYIGQLTGAPFGEGAATVWRWVPGRDPEVYADGFTHIIDLAFTDDGDLLVLQITRRSLLYAFTEGDWTGALYLVPEDDPDEKHELFVDDAGEPLTDEAGGPLLFAPGGLAVDRDTVYLSNKSVLAGAGEILRFEIDD
ncbi:ScyD/ScyE family protein [Georgenia satyanarayanai]|uniref:ScyD/ScyE family protein n=1 Tax=Georgenia satyanarayanai TaxID=860221 RepID=UPI00186B3B9A|nr:ScyD/ScyE family protein [Georgenia satyanarayanai]